MQTARGLVESVFAGEIAERVPVYGIITSVPLIEHLTGTRLSRENSETVAIEASRKSIDITRLFADGLGPTWQTGHSEDSFGYSWQQEMWTKWVEKRPFDNLKEMRSALES